MHADYAEIGAAIGIAVAAGLALAAFIVGIDDDQLTASEPFHPVAELPGIARGLVSGNEAAFYVCGMSAVEDVEVGSADTDSADRDEDTVFESPRSCGRATCCSPARSGTLGCDQFKPLSKK